MRLENNQTYFWASVLLAGALGACSGSDTPSNINTNNNNTSAETTCAPTCDADACMVCQIDGDDARCASACGAGLTCESGQCIAPAVSSCDPACGPCEVCDLNGDAPVCRAACAAGLLCVEGVCQAPEVISACDPACGACQLCDASGEAPICVDRCDAEEACTPDGVCVRAGFHATFDDLTGPFPDGPSVTQVCIGCHQEEAEDVVHGPHFQWRGATPGLAGHEGDTTIGKRNLINNFCVSIPGNEKRCSQCHAGYGYEDQTFDFEDITKIDCLVCHADPASGYKKAPKTAGRPADDVDLMLAAQSVGATSRGNCGSCHFSAGGGDNVKKGDMGSALNHPSVGVDAHMGAGFTCSNCHAGSDHALLGQGVHNPVSEGRLDCTDCHSQTPHEQLSILDEHAQDVACQTCHIPAFSRTQATKMNWDWSTAGNKTRGTDGVEKTMLEDGTQVTAYDFMKGDFVWQKEVKPTYAWHDGSAVHMTLADTFSPGAGTSDDNAVRIAYPLADKLDANAKIFPFKVMKGRQPGHLTGGYLIAPKLFGPGGFWPQIPAADDYTEEGVRALWTSSLTLGARAGGQLPPDGTIADGDWGWLTTEMYLGINHEVAPKEMALGQPPCEGCHFNPEFPWEELGYLCDPIRSPAACGSRHFQP